MNTQNFFLNRDKRGILLLECVKTVLFLMCFLISLYFSFGKDTLFFGLTIGGMVLYVLLILGTFFFRNRKP